MPAKPKQVIRHEDCCDGMDAMRAGSVALGFGDPPYNIGFDYDGEYNDSLPPREYLAWSGRWLRCVYRVLAPTGSFFLMIGDEWAAELKCLANDIGFHLRSWIVWHYTFGVNCTHKFTRSHAHIFYFTKHKKDFVFNADQVRVPSARAVVYKDKRASPDGRLPDDTWILRPQNNPALFGAECDTWYIPRICGTYNERVDGAPNQLPEQLLGRIIRACSNPGDLVLDPFCGTGTTVVVAKKLGREGVTFETSGRFAGLALERWNAAKLGDPLDGLIPQGG